MQEIKITRAQTLKEKPESSTLVFGKSMTDHMFIVDYDAGQGWHDPRIVPYAPLQIDPAAKGLHYAQEIFEGLKAYRTDAGPGWHHGVGQAGAGLGPPREGHLLVYPSLYDRPGRRPGRTQLPPLPVHRHRLPRGRLLS